MADNNKYGNIWVSILIAVAIGIVIGFVNMGLGIWANQIQKNEPGLYYSFNTTIPIQIENQSTGIYSASVFNMGNKSAANVKAYIQIPNGRIIKYNIECIPPIISYTEQIKVDSITLYLTSLNPNEKVAISILAESNTTLPSEPVVYARNSEITATKLPTPGTFEINWNFLFIWSAIMGIIGTSLTIWNLLYRKKHA